MEDRECVICSGDKFIRLPVRHRLSPMYLGDADIPIRCEESSRTYPCPECNTKTAAEEKVSTLYATQTVQERDATRGDIISVVAPALANVMARKFLDEKLIQIDQERRGDDVVFIAKMAVVNPKAATRIERRALDKMKQFLGKVADKAADSIAVWGSHYTGNDGSISKGQAIGYMREAFAVSMREAEEKVAKE